MIDLYISIKDLVVEFPDKNKKIIAVDHISLDIDRGEIFGIAGESGCGKTTTGLSILGAVKKPGRVSGSIKIGEIDVNSLNESSLRKFRWSKVSMVFQGAMNSLNPVKTIGSQISDVMIDHEAAKPVEAMERAKQLLTEVGLQSFVFYKYPHQLSGGQKQRVVIAMALSLQPEVIIADEPTTALDVLSQERILKLLVDIAKARRMTVILISHDIMVLSKVCDRIAIMYLGKIVEVSAKEKVMKYPAHPYTFGLLKSYISIDKRNDSIEPIPGSPEYGKIYSNMCRFSPRCFKATDICRKEEPEMMRITANHEIYCFNPIQRDE